MWKVGSVLICACVLYSGIAGRAGKHLEILELNKNVAIKQSVDNLLLMSRAIWNVFQKERI